MMKDGTMSVADAEEEFNLILSSSPAVGESSSPIEQEEDSPFVDMQTELHSKGAVLTKAWADLFSFITKYQAELVVKENSVEIAENEIEQRKRQLEEMKPVVDAGNEEITQLQDEIRTKERMLSKAQSQLSVKERMLQRVQSDLTCNRELLEKAQCDLLGKQNDLIRNRSDLERLKSELKMKQEQIEIKDNLLKKLQNQLMKENAELKEQLELERRSHELEKQSHELTKRSLVSQSMQSERRKRQRTDDVPAVVEIPDSPPTLDLSDVAGDFGLTDIISMATASPAVGPDPQQRKPSSEPDTSPISADVQSHSPSFDDSDRVRHMPTLTSQSQWDIPTPPKVSRSSRCMSSLSVTPSQTSAPSTSCISDSITAMTSSDTFFPLSVSEDVKPGMDTLTSCMQMDSDSQGNMPIIKPGTPSSGISDSNQGPVPVSGPIANPGMSPGCSTDGRADGKIKEESYDSFVSKLNSGELQVSEVRPANEIPADFSQQNGTVSLMQEKWRKNTCHLCGNYCLNEAILKIHLKVHAGEKPFSCSYCEKGFDRKTDLTVHERIHTGEKPYQCSDCGKGFINKTDFTKHERTHTGEQPYKCGTCDRAFSQHSSYVRHMRIHVLEESHDCHKCSKKFISRAKLKEHVATHSRGASKRKVKNKCSYCMKSLSHRNALKLHLRTHTGERPFKCSYCGKAFNQKGYVKTHERIHTGEKPFKCDVCGKTFNDISVYRKHVRIHATSM